MKSSPNLLHAQDAQGAAFNWDPVDFEAQKPANGSAVIRSAGQGNGKNGQNLFAFPDFEAGASRPASNNGNGHKAPGSSQPGQAPKAGPALTSPSNGAPDKSSVLSHGSDGVSDARPFFLNPAKSNSRMRFIKGSEPDAQTAWAGWLADEFNAEKEFDASIEAPDFEALRQQIITETLALAKIQAQEQTERALSVARSQADEICQKAQAEASEVTRQAYREGIAAAQAEATEMLMLARTVVEEVRHWRGSMLAQSEPLVLGLVQEISHKIFGQGLILEEAALKTAFGNALSEAKSLGDLRIRAHPEDVAILGALWPTQMTAVTGQKIELVPNQDLERGSCYIEGQYGSVDARVKTQMRLVNETLGRVLADDVLPTNPFTTYEEEVVEEH